VTTVLPNATSTEWRGARVARVAEVVVFGLLPLLALGYVFGKVLFTDLDVYAVLPYTAAADAIVHGHNPYPSLTDPDFLRGAGYVYPPLVAILSMPLTLIPFGVAEVVMMVLLVAALVGTLWALDVRDWRCYGLPFLWPPVLSAIQTGNVTLFMGLAAALAWRFRDHDRAVGLSVGVSLAAKLFLWPLVAWMLATRRFRAALWTVGFAFALLSLTWGAIGFAGLTGYPSLLHHWTNYADDFAFSLYAVALDLGAASSVALGVWLAGAVAALVCAFVLGRRGDDRGSFVLALSAAIAYSPIVWLHYFALLVVVVAVLERQLGPAWFAPLLIWVTMGAAAPAIGNGTTAQTVATLGVAVLTVALAFGARAYEAGTRRMTVTSLSR
jgi:alpha-1,2-mannosyltransferase